MRILLDECVDRRLARDLSQFEIRTVPSMGWAGVKNGELLRLAQAHFEIFLTVDRNLSFQQDLSNFDIALIVLRSASNRYSDLALFSDKIAATVLELKAGEVKVLTLD